jgi:tetratricopeptide (TPR) repeat protein
MINVHDVLEKARTSGQELSPSEAAVLFAAAVRLAAARSLTLRSRLLEIDEGGGLHLSAFDEHKGEAEPAYLAPELRGPEAPPHNEPRVQVYAAGALGYELITGKPPPQRPLGSELRSPLGDVVRVALSADRRERFGDLNQLQDALMEVQGRAPAEGERNILMALRTRFVRPPLEKEAVARLIEKVAALEQQVAKLSARTESFRESIEHFEEGQRRLTTRKPPSAAVPGFLAGLLAAAAVLGAAYAAGWLGPARTAPPAPAADAKPVQKSEATPMPDVAPDAMVAAQVPDAGPAEDAVAAAPDASAAAAAEPVKTAEPPKNAEPPKTAEPASKTASDAGAKPADAAPKMAETAPKTDAEPASKGADQLKAAPEPPKTTAAEPPPPPAPRTASAAPDASPRPARASKRRSAPAAMNHALAVSQVHRGESALEQGNATDALASFRGALESEPGIPTAYRGMGMAFAIQGENSLALQAYEKYLELSPSADDAADVRRSMDEIRQRGKVAK